ncbi:MAG: phosphoribosylaminoimidazolesuccinocarboxamide synthase [Candidatus Caldatribacteriota bacterium]|nr:phosphoribosylaminoimidazolesuccinocarboxamide synthase [Candidatus Caldatribacteriota bacterium]
MGSVKDLKILKKPNQNGLGLGRFIFSDRYSVFDWGEMPDHIENKGKSLCISAAYFFEKLEKMGIKTHYVGLVENGAPGKLADIKNVSDTMEVKLVRVLKPVQKDNTYDYSLYKTEQNNFLIPLEIIYRNSLPKGSSVFKRLKDGSLKLKDLNLKKIPVPGQDLEKPLLDVSTKLESSDRYMDWNEAKENSHLSIQEMEEIKRITRLINQLIKEEAEKIGLKYEDGKIELAFDKQRKLLVVDVLGTLDECRFTYEGMPVSKEIARIYYRKTDWYKELVEAKKKYGLNWKEKISTKPSPLPADFKKLISMAYCAFSNEITGREWFSNIPPMKEILKKIIKFIQ